MFPSQGITSGGIWYPSVSHWWWSFWSPSQDVVQFLHCTITDLYSPLKRTGCLWGNTLRPCTDPDSHLKILFLGSTDECCLMATKWWLPNSSTQSTLTTQPSPFSYRFTTGMDFWVTIAFQWFKTHYLVILVLKLYKSCLPWHAPTIFIRISLLFGTTECSRLTWCLSAPALESALSLRSPSSSEWGMVLEVSHKMWLLLLGIFACWPFHQAGQKLSACTDASTYARTHTYIQEITNMYEHIYTHITKIMISHWYFHRVRFFAVFHTCTSLISQWKPRLPTSHIQY